MCGIFFTTSFNTPLKPNEKTLQRLRARGPDELRITTVNVPARDVSQQTRVLTFCSSVLALRGDFVQAQPLLDSLTGSVLCWNGEAWKINDEQVTGNDTISLFDLFLSAIDEQSPPDAILNLLTKVSGPFAFVFFDGRSSTLYFGRDRLGRRSLVIEEPNPGQLTISSISTDPECPPCEVSTEFIHSVQLNIQRSTQKQLSWPTTMPAINKILPTTAIGVIPSQDAIDSVKMHLIASLRLRVLQIPSTNLHLQDKAGAKLAVLFSGGLDCTLLARLIHDLIPVHETIDLLNVAFENPRSIKANNKPSDCPYESCPDRITGRNSFAELQRECSSRFWRFIAINIPYSEVVHFKPEITHLMRPHATEMDLSIAMALFFAARGEGSAAISNMSGKDVLYSTAARVLISGLGADELFAGYARHLAAFVRDSFQGLVEELELDFSRIGTRNLGRDDRVLSHWGKEIRYPYLDEDFVRHALLLPVWEKCGFRLNKPVPKHYEEVKCAEEIQDLDPAKMLLRMLTWQLGLHRVASERKRAIQFGARTAKMEIGAGRRKGTALLSRP